MAQNIEDFLPPIQSAGLNTGKNTSLGGTLSVTGNTTLSGTLSVTGASTLTGKVSFATNPSYTGGKLQSMVSATTNATLTIAQSGSTVLFNSTTGVQLTLPAPQVGAYYDLVVAQTPSSGTHGILTNSGSVFLGGALVAVAGGGSTASGTSATFAANGTSHIGVGMNGTTSGGIAGSVLRVVASSTTVWRLTGVLSASGSTLATPII